VTKIDARGTAIVYSTFLGGGGEDEGTAIAVDRTGRAYVTGATTSSDFPVKRAVQPARAGASDAFVTTLSPMGWSLFSSTYLGGSVRRRPRARAGPFQSRVRDRPDGFRGLPGPEILPARARRRPGAAGPRS
jgi:hypothetical protein